MPELDCPYCGSRNFYVKDPEDQYEIYEFDLEGGQVQFLPREDEDSKPPEVGGDTETYCGLCAWHGKFNALQRPR
jgi:hypothetical protein